MDLTAYSYSATPTKDGAFLTVYDERGDFVRIYFDRAKFRDFEAVILKTLAMARGVWKGPPPMGG
jgi:hypothetical protein